MKIVTLKAPFNHIWGPRGRGQTTYPSGPGIKMPDAAYEAAKAAGFVDDEKTKGVAGPPGKVETVKDEPTGHDRS